MDDNQFKKDFKVPACTKVPWAYLIPRDKKEEVLRSVRNECIDTYGYSLDQCNKRMVCFGQSCSGRQLPWKSTTAYPYLVKFAKQQGIELGADYFVKTCSECPIAQSCKSPCYQVNDYLQRAKSEEPVLILKESNENTTHQPSEEDILPSVKDNLTIPWDCLTEQKQTIVKMYLYDKRDFKYIAEKLELNNQANVKYQYYSALTRLSEYAVMRKFIIDSSDKLGDNRLAILNSVYNENRTLTATAKLLGSTKQAIEQLLARIIKSNDIKWNKFVKKKNKKVIYNLSEVLK